MGGGSSPGSAAPLSVQRADWWIRAGRHEDAVGVEVVKSGPVHEDVVSLWHALTSSEGHRVGRVRHGVVNSHQPFLVGVLQLFLMQDGVHLHSGQEHRQYLCPFVSF